MNIEIVKKAIEEIKNMRFGDIRDKENIEQISELRTLLRDIFRLIKLI